MEESTASQRSESLHSGSQVSSTSQEQRKYTCAICSKSCKTKSNLNEHLSFHTNERPFKCTTCGNAFKTSKTLKKHEFIHTGEKPFKCPKCTSKFSTQYGLKRHTQLVHEKNPTQSWKCGSCHKSFSCVLYLSMHIKTHSNLKPFVCIACNRRSRTLQSLMNHIGNRHLQEKPFLCDQCPAGCIQVNRLNFHIQTVHKKEELEKNKCAVCEKIYRSREELNRHMNSHTGEKPFKCLVCNKAFSQKSTLKTHAATHDENRLMYSCKICNKTVTSARNLKRHEERHTGKKAFKCGECSIAFLQLSNLNRHIKQVHRKERRVPCTLCVKFFFSAQDRDQHMAVHLNEMPHQCKICGKRFKYNISRHMKSHNELTDSYCTRCPKRFFSRVELLAHYLKVHVGSNENLLECLFCDRKVRSMKALELHIQKHTKERY